MNRPSRPVRVLAPVLAAGSLLTAAACANDDGASDTVSVSPAAERSPSPSATPALTRAGAKAALITTADLEGHWTQANDAASWRTTLLVDKVDVAAFLKAKTSAAECQRLLDSLYSDSLLGRASGGSALTGFTDPHSRLLYQVGDYGRDSLTKTLDWLGSLPKKCDQFTATGSDGSERTVQVVAAGLPAVVDAREGVTVTVRGTAGGQPTTLTLDVAALRVGASGAAVTNGGPVGARHKTTETAVREGARRLTDVLAGRTPTANPSLLD
ncbi:hypothetical protein [Streptomyces sp. NPDC006012]|uniref:hypothetical protein n=1 Tax=Streptomyces sp. NPDC006012 TaxID=3364739 RepID=UPI00369BFDE6